MQKNDIVQTFLNITIGCFVASFISKSYDLVIEDEFDKCENDADCKSEIKWDKLDDYQTTKMMYMLVIGFILVILGGVIAKNNPDYPSRGISIGGIFLVILYVSKNWSKFGEAYQVMIMGLIIAGLMYAGANNLANIN